MLTMGAITQQVARLEAMKLGELRPDPMMDEVFALARVAPARRSSTGSLRST
jgi:hypothetical protein